uniref:Prokineticin 1 n=1 Tax=Pelusios castaneus TaxID=367368 RepID=A0A8C8RGC6_9SAUR
SLYKSQAPLFLLLKMLLRCLNEKWYRNARDCKDLQCGAGTCCAISLWLRGLRMCTPLGQEGDECHPFNPVRNFGIHREVRLKTSRSLVPFFGKRQHHTCPCLPNFICSRFIDGRFRCSVDFKNIDF